MIKPLPNSLFAGISTLVYCRVILTIRFFLVVILKAGPTSFIPVK
jgi:hypothetical protein